MLKQDILKISDNALQEDRQETIINDNVKIIHHVEFDNNWLWTTDGLITGVGSSILIYSILLNKNQVVKGYMFKRNNPYDGQIPSIKDYTSLFTLALPNRYIKRRVRKDIKEYADNL